MDVLKRNNVAVRGAGPQAMLFAHGFGCDQNMWRYVAPAFEDRYQTIVFDNVGAGHSDLDAYDFNKYAGLDGYADDVIDIARALDLKDAIFVGHSVSTMIGIIAAAKAPDLFSRLILVSPSPRYINTDGYVGGFSRDEIDELLASLDANHLGWSMSMAPVIMGNADRAELSDELANSFCRTDPAIARHFAKATFLSDTRDLLATTAIPSLILQCSHDVIAPQVVGEYMHAQMPDSTLVIMQATGHCPNLSAPAETIAAIEAYLAHD